jgi:hypothetical protein
MLMRPILHQHFRGGLYVLSAIAEDASNVDPRPGQFAVYYDLAQCRAWFRPVSEFHESVTLLAPDERQVARFGPVSRHGEVRHWLETARRKTP